MKAVITAANPHHRNLPLQTLSDASGSSVPLLRLHLQTARRLPPPVPA